MSSYWEDQELVAAALGLSEDEYSKILNEDESKLDEMLFEKWEVSIEQFANISNALLPLTMPVKTAVTGSTVQVFGRHESGMFTAIVKTPFKEG